MGANIDAAGKFSSGFRLQGKERRLSRLRPWPLQPPRPQPQHIERRGSRKVLEFRFG